MASAGALSTSPLRIVETQYQLALLGLVSSGYLAIATGGLLDASAVILTGSALLLRALILKGWVQWSPPAHFEARAGICYLLFYPIDWYFLSRDSIPATVHLLLFLGTVRLFTAKSPRDYRFVQTLALLQMLAATLAANVYFLVFLISFLMFGIATLAGAEILRSASRPSLILRTGLKSFGWTMAGLTFFIAATIGLIASGLFFALPRSAHAVFRHLASDKYRLPGLSNEVSLGAIGEIQRNDTPLVHIRMLGQVRPENLKWRGMVLSRFDGKRWTQGPLDAPAIRVEHGFAKLSDRSSAGLPWFQYEVRMNDLVSDVLFFAGRPQMTAIAVPSVMGSINRGFRAPARPTGPFSYTGYSVLEEPGATNTALGVEEMTENLKLPFSDKRVEQLASDWTAGATTPFAQANAIEKHLKKDFSYTLELPSVEADDPVAYFLLERKKGHCEYFASAMAVLMRERGIPARVVTGFQSGVMNPLNGWLLLRGGDAHSWAEVWIDGRGWMTFDPTPASTVSNRPSWMEHVRFYLDAIDVFWGEWVVGYDFEQQLKLAVQLHDSGRSTSVSWLDRLAAATAWLNNEGPAAVKRSGPTIIATLVALFGLWRLGKWARGVGAMPQLLKGRGPGPVHDATLLYQRMLRALSKRGVAAKSPAMTAGEFAAATVVSHPELGRQVREITSVYERVRFGGDPAGADKLFELVTHLERPERR